MQITDTNIYSFWKSLSTTLVHDKYEQLCVQEEQSRNWKCMVVTFEDNPQGCWGFFCTRTSFSGYVNHTVQSIWLCHFWITFTWCFHETVAARAQVVVSTLQRLHMKPGLAALCITYLPKHPRGQLRAEFPGTPWRGKPRVMLHTSVCTVARPSLTACPRPRLVWYFICPLCHVTYLRWANRPAGTKGFCFLPWGQCEQGKRVLGKLLPSKYCWFWQQGHMSACHILKTLEGNSLDQCCYCKVILHD